MITFGTLGAAQITPAALIYPAMNEPLARVRVIAARNRERAEAFAAAHHIKTVCDTYDEVVNHPDINALYNPLHIPAHHDWTIAALKAGKHVLCEKSIACNAAEATEMQAVASETGLVLMDAFHYRYHPLFAALIEIVRGGELGDVHTINAAFHVPVRGQDNIRMNYALGGGVTMDIGCYPISWVRHLTGKEPTVISAEAEVGPPHVDLMLRAKMDIDGMAITTEGDMRGQSGFKADLSVSGSRGELHVSNVIAPQMGHLLTLTRDGVTTTRTFDRRASYCYQLDAFIGAINNGDAIPTDGADAIAQMKVIDRCYEAAGLPLRGLSL